MNISALSSSVPMSLPNRFKYNAGTEFNGDFSLNWYETPFKGFDAQLGRFMQIDPMADVLSSITPYNYGYNNPIMFNDPTGLIGENGKNDKKKDCPEGDCDPVYDGGSAGTFVVEGERESTTSTPSYVGGYWNYYLNKWKGGNPIERGLYSNYRVNGLAGVHNVLGHSRTLSFSADGYRDAIAQGKRTQQALSKLVAIGVGGTLLATAALPMVVDIMAEAGLMELSKLSLNGFGGRFTGDLAFQAIPDIMQGQFNVQTLDFASATFSGFGVNYFFNSLGSSVIDLNLETGLSVQGLYNTTDTRNNRAIQFGLGMTGTGLSNIAPGLGTSKSKFIPQTLIGIITNMAIIQYQNQNDNK